MWIDGAGCNTYAKYALFDPTAELFPKSRSVVKSLLQFYGGEDHLEPNMPYIVQQLNELRECVFVYTVESEICERKWELHISASLRFLVLDHHAGAAVINFGGGSGLHADSCGGLFSVDLLVRAVQLSRTPPATSGAATSFTRRRSTT